MTAGAIEVFEDLDQLARRAAEMFVRSSRESTAVRGRFTVVLSGGSTPQRLYGLLAEDLEYRDRIPWRAIHFFWGDERCVPPDHPENNFNMVTSAMLSKLGLGLLNNSSPCSNRPLLLAIRLARTLIGWLKSNVVPRPAHR